MVELVSIEEIQNRLEGTQLSDPDVKMNVEVESPPVPQYQAISAKQRALAKFVSSLRLGQNVRDPVSTSCSRQPMQPISVVQAVGFHFKRPFGLSKRHMLRIARDKRSSLRRDGGKAALVMVSS